MTTLNRKILLRRGDRSELSSTMLDIGEPGFATDTNQLYIGIEDAVDEIMFDPFANAHGVVQSWLDSNINPEPGLVIDEALVIKNVADVEPLIYAMINRQRIVITGINLGFSVDDTIYQIPDTSNVSIASGVIVNIVEDTILNTTTIFADSNGTVIMDNYMKLDGNPYWFSNDENGLQSTWPQSVDVSEITPLAYFGYYARPRRNVEVITENSFNQMFADQHLESHSEATGLRASLFKKTLTGTSGTFLKYDKDVNTTFFVDYSLVQEGIEGSVNDGIKYVRVGTIKVINGVPHDIDDCKLTDDNTEIWQDSGVIGEVEPNEFSNILFESSINNVTGNIEINYTQDVDYGTEISYTVKRWSM